MPPKGETKDQATKRRAKFYHDQRTRAEETGDQKTTDRIYKKLGKKSHSVDANATDKAFLGAVASTMGTRGLGKIGGAMRTGRAAASLGESAGASSGPKALTGGVGRVATKVRTPAKPGGTKSLAGGAARKALPNTKLSSMNEPVYEKALRKGGPITSKMRSAAGRTSKPTPKGTAPKKKAA